MTVDRLAELVARRHDARALACLGREREPARGDRARDVVRLHLGDVGPELLERAADLAREARLDRLLQRRIALAHDLVHDRGFHAGGLELGEGLSGIDGVELFRVAHQHDPGDAELVRDAQKVAGLDRGGKRAFVDDQDGLCGRGADLARALLREPAFRDAGVPREEPLQGFRFDARFRRQRLHGRGRGREARHAPALLLGKGARTIQHRGLARAGVGLDADHAGRRGEDELHRLLLPRRQRPLVEVALHRPAPHRGAALVVSRPHQRDGLALLADRAVRRERVLRPRQAHRV